MGSKKCRRSRGSSRRRGRSLGLDLDRGLARKNRKKDTESRSWNESWEGMRTNAHTGRMTDGRTLLLFGNVGRMCMVGGFIRGTSRDDGLEFTCYFCSVPRSEFEFSL